VIQKYLQGADLNFPNENDYPALISAIKYNRDNVTQWLARQKLDINQRDNTGNTALHIAASLGQLKTLIALKSKISYFNSSNNKKQTPLMLAVLNKHEATAQWLIDNKANLNLHDSSGNNVKDYNLAAKLSLNYNQKKNTVSSQKKQVKKELNKQQYVHQLKALSAQAISPKSPYYNWPTLLIATAQKQTELSSTLINQGSDPWLLNNNNETALSIAVSTEQWNLVERMIQAAPVTESRNPESLKQLYLLAVQKENINLSNHILVPLSHKTKMQFRQAGLKQAVVFGSFDIAKRLMSELKVPNLAELLHHSINQNRTRISTLMITNWAPLEWKDKNGRTALLLTAENANNEVMSLLLGHNAMVEASNSNGQTALMLAVQSQCIKCVELLQANNAKPHKQSKNGNSAIMLAAKTSNIILQKLINDETDLSVRNKQSHTALMLAVNSNNIESVRTLLMHDANPRRKNSRGQDSYDLASGYPKILALLNDN